MAHPKLGRLSEYARKGVELAQRELAVAPEQRAARRLVDSERRTAPVTGPSVLFLTTRDWAAHVQYESVMAHALSRRGARVRFLTCGGGLEICDRANTYEAPPMPCRTCAHYVETSLSAHGLPHEALRASWDTDGDDGWPELDAIRRGDLEAVEWNGLPLGRLVAIPVRWFLCAADVDDDPLAGTVYRSFLRSARRIARALEPAIDADPPDVAVLLNGLFLFEAIAAELCRARGIEVVTYERAFLPETLVFSGRAPAGVYDFSDRWAQEDRVLTPAEAAELDDYLARRRRGGAADQYWRFSEAAVDRGDGRLAVLFTNLTWDTAVIDRDRAFGDIREWLDASVRYFAGRPVDRLVVRIHPSETHLPGKRTRDSLEAYLRRHHRDLPPNVTILGADDVTSSYPLMDAADVGLVYTSTTGLELALTGTPVLVAGETHYRGKGFTIDVDSRADWTAALDAILADPASAHSDVEAARRYAHFFFFRAPIAAPGVTEPLPGLARVTLRSLDELDPGRDERVDRICAEILGGRAGDRLARDAG